MTTRFKKKPQKGLLPLGISFLFAWLILASCSGDQLVQDYFYRAEQAFASGELQQAAHFYELFLENEQDSPNRIIAWERLLLIYLDIGRDVDLGMNVLKSMSVEYEKERDKLWSIIIRMAQLYAQQKKFESSIETFEKAIKIAGDDKQLILAYLEIAEVYYKRSDFLMVLEVLNDSLKSVSFPSPDQQGRINYLLGKTHYQLKDKDSAIYYLLKTLYSDAGENQRSKAGILLYDVYMEESNVESANRVLNELEKFYPNPMVIRMRQDDISNEIN